MTSSEKHRLADAVREECIRTAVAAYENASISGLCGEGAFEAAVSAMRMLELEELTRQSQSASSGGW